MKIEKIIFTGDLLRPSENGQGSNQRVNINWLYNLLIGPVQIAVNADIKVLNWDDRPGAFDSKLFYRLNDSSSLPSDWIRLYHQKHYSKAALEYVRSHFGESLVIGFELPDIFMHMFDELGIHYIDIINHPVRFMDDIFFGFRTNNEAIYRRLIEYNIDPNVYIIQAGLHKATISRMKQKNIPINSALFTGQVDVDKSLISNGKILNLLDFHAEFESIARKHEKVYYKKHPYANQNEAIEQFLKQFKNVEYIDENFYYLLGQQNIVSVYSISSSTVYEAKLWGKHSEYFYQSPFELVHDKKDTSSALRSYIAVYNEFFDPKFWADILQSECTTHQINVSSVSLAPKTSRLRNSLQYYWGYNFLDTEILLNNSHLKDQQDFLLNKDLKIEQVIKELNLKVEKLMKNVENPVESKEPKQDIQLLLAQLQSSIVMKREELEQQLSQNTDVKPDKYKDSENTKVYSLKSFYEYKSSEFIANAVRSILKRNPTEAEQYFYRFALRNKEMKKEQILSNLLQSQEGKKQGVKIKGLKMKLFFTYMYAIYKLFF